MDNINVASCIALGAVLPAVDCVVVGLRVYAKYTRRGLHSSVVMGLTIDDFLIIFALALVVATGIIFIIGTQIAGFGHFLPSDSSEAALSLHSPLLVETKRLAELANYLAPWMYGAPKLSILFLYRLIFRGKLFNISFWTLTITTFCFIITAWLLILLQCGTHIDVEWGTSNSIRAQCLVGALVVVPIAGIDVLIDLCILILPLMLIWQLHMVVWKKLATTIVFIFGGLAIAASIVRLVKFRYLYFGEAQNEYPDQFQFNTSVVYWSLLEGGLCIIPACLPILGSLVSEDFGSMLSRNIENGWYHLRTIRSPTGSSRSTAGTAIGRRDTARRQASFEDSTVRLPRKAQAFASSKGHNIELSTVGAADGRAAPAAPCESDGQPTSLEIGVAQDISVVRG